jgi:hypothetical protein
MNEISKLPRINVDLTSITSKNVTDDGNLVRRWLGNINKRTESVGVAVISTLSSRTVSKSISPKSPDLGSRTTPLRLRVPLAI